MHAARFFLVGSAIAALAASVIPAAAQSMTVDEFRHAPPRRRAYYRAYHSMLVMFTVGPMIKFVFLQRKVSLPGSPPARVRRSATRDQVGSKSRRTSSMAGAFASS